MNEGAFCIYLFIVIYCGFPDETVSEIEPRVGPLLCGSGGLTTSCAVLKVKVVKAPRAHCPSVYVSSIGYPSSSAFLHILPRQVLQ